MSFTRRRAGFTLAEMVVSVAVLSVLLVSIGSAVIIATRAIPDRRNPASHATLAANALTQVAEELGNALHILENEARSVTFTVADRSDPDLKPEVIRYAWSGTPGDPLTRQYNGGTAVVMLENVRQLALNYAITQVAEPYEATSVEGAEETIFSYDDLLNLSALDIKVTSSNWPGQLFRASSTAAAKTWRLSRIQFRGQSAGSDVSGSTQIQLRLPASEGAVLPGETVVDEVIMPESVTSNGWLWYETTFSNALGLQPNLTLALLFITTGSDSLKLEHYSSGVSIAGAGFLLGPTWTNTSSKAVRLYVYGRKTAPPAGAPANTWARQHIDQIRIDLAAGPDGASTAITTGTTVSMFNRPQVLAAAWETDFSSDPTAADSDGNGIADWIGSGSDVSDGSIANGVWTADTTLHSNPGNDFITPTAVHVRFRNTTAGGDGAQVWINADRSGGYVAPIRASLQRQADLTQTLTVYKVDALERKIPLIQVPKLTTDFVSLRLLIDPTRDTVNVRVEGYDAGTFSYERKLANDNIRSVTLLTSGSTSQFDHVSIRVRRAQ